MDPSIYKTSRSYTAFCLQKLDLAAPWKKSPNSELSILGRVSNRLSGYKSLKQNYKGSVHLNSAGVAP